MPKYYNFRFDMRLEGKLTSLPDSQKIFGALIYLYSERASSKRASRLVSEIKDGVLYFALSNMMPYGYLIVPRDLLLYDLSFLYEDKKQQHNNSRKETYKHIKRRQYMKTDQLIDLLNQPKEKRAIAASSIYPYVYEIESQSIHVALDSLQYDLPALDPNLFSTQETTVLEATSDKKQDLVTEYSFYLSAKPCKLVDELIEILCEAIKEGLTLALGPRASLGFNTYCMTAMEETERSQKNRSNRFLNLGMLLSKEIDFEKSTLNLFTSQRRPYDMQGGWNDMAQTYFVSFIKAGSLIYPLNGLENAGCCLASPYDRSNAIVFGNGYLFPVPDDPEVSIHDRI